MGSSFITILIAVLLLASNLVSLSGHNEIHLNANRLTDFYYENGIKCGSLHLSLNLWLKI